MSLLIAVNLRRESRSHPLIKKEKFIKRKEHTL